MPNPSDGAHSKVDLVSQEGDHGGAKSFTAIQGQYLAFIRAYILINGRPPAEADLQRFFRVTAPTVHQMILTLEKRKLIMRSPRVARSIQLLIQATDLPPLEEPSKDSA